MKLKTKNGSIGISPDAFGKSKDAKSDFFRAINTAGYSGDFEKAWKDYQAESAKHKKKKPK